MSTSLLEFAGIEKSFFGVQVLKRVSFHVQAGRVVGLVGENGAGKSTLMNILGGNLMPDGGHMRFEGVDFKPANPQDAERRRIAFIHQELNLFPNLTVAENLFLTRFQRTKATPFINRAAIFKRAADLLGQAGLDLLPERLVETLSAGERQLVEVAKAMSIDAQLIIFDEPTTSLGVRETERLFELIGRLRDQGVAMIYISHTLADVFRLCDDIVVLRDGEVVSSGAADTFTSNTLVSMMVGRSITQLYPARGAAPGTEPLLKVRGFSQPGVIENISFTLNHGEVLGLAGLMGAGRSELARSIFGLDRFATGELRLNGQLLQKLTPAVQISRGIAFVTENRRTEGLCLDASVAENLTLVNLLKFTRSSLRWILLDPLRAAVGRIRQIVRLDSKASDAQTVRTLSGGNQQKVVLGKWLIERPRVLILDEPTRGIDVGAKFEIYRLIHDLAGEGTGVLLISSELEELMGLCDRILVMRQGELVDELNREQFDRERILRAALHSSPAKESSG